MVLELEVAKREIKISASRQSRILSVFPFWDVVSQRRLSKLQMAYRVNLKDAKVVFKLHSTDVMSSEAGKQK